MVLGAAETKFLKPVKTGDLVHAEAEVEPGEGKKKVVQVTVLREGEKVFEGTFICFVLDKHVLT